MMTSDPRDLDAAASIMNGEAAEQLLTRRRDPAMVRALATRADELRFEQARAAFGIAEAALRAFRCLPPRLQRPGLACLAWAAYGSILRTLARFEESELALAMAVRYLSRSRPEAWADLSRRFAYLRADQGQRQETRRLVARFVSFARCAGQGRLGKELANAGAIMIVNRDYRAALTYSEEALSLLPLNGDRRHISAVYNVARCSLELASSHAEVLHVLELTRQAGKLIEPDSYNQLQLRWLDGRLHYRLERFDKSLELLESARRGIDEQGDGYDRALLVLDIAEVHLERGDAASAQELARSSFGILSALRKDQEAYKAMQIFYRAGVALAVDRATIDSVRQRLLELQRRPRRPAR